MKSEMIAHTETYTSFGRLSIARLLRGRYRRRPNDIFINHFILTMWIVILLLRRRRSSSIGGVSNAHQSASDNNAASSSNCYYYYYIYYAVFIVRVWPACTTTVYSIKLSIFYNVQSKHALINAAWTVRSFSVFVPARVVAIGYIILYCVAWCALQVPAPALSRNFFGMPGPRSLQQGDSNFYNTIYIYRNTPGDVAMHYMLGIKNQWYLNCPHSPHTQPPTQSIQSEMNRGIAMRK